MSKLYTHTIYTKFQAEVSGIVACIVGKEGEDERTITFRVDDLEMKQSFSVSWNKGKSAVCVYAICLNIADFSVDILYQVQRLNDLCKLAIKLGEEGSLSGEAYQVACHALEEALERCAVMNNSVKCVLETNKTASQVLSNVGQKEDNNNTMKALKTKNVPKKRKVQAEAETLSIRIQDSSQDVEQLNQISLSLHDSFISPQDLQGMELGTRIPVINGYYGVQQGSQGPGNLNSLSSLQDYYSDQPLVQGVLLQGQLSFRASPLEGCFQLRDGLHNENSVSTTSKHLRD
ncbi:UNVERIFIED_CONTAM: protein FAR1-RELATED SEQUENCE 4 [Sesamum calycinum]|uniref:Protein FAR1-RELATED SEQUENCE 4 n=1 Tax=Sesamum calycinum TaxID=2727403 RepID=A0AAW2NTI8_9LAMI